MIKATVKENGMTVRVEYMGKMSYYITVEGKAVECHPDFGGAVAAARRIAALGPEEFELRQQYAA
jgi:hypothetical protein